MSSSDESDSDHKGLANDAGQNNCFLNVVIQGFWHMKPFREQFTEKENHEHPIGVTGETCVFCALKVIFTQFHFSKEPHLPPTALRKALSVLYQNVHKFQVGDLDDASEAYEAMLNCLHEAMVGASRGERKQCDPLCFVHTIFGIYMVEQSHCTNEKCLKSSDPFPFTSFMQFASVEMLKAVFEAHESSSTFDNLLKGVLDLDSKICPNEKCRQPVDTMRFLTHQPHVFSICLNWGTDSCSAADIEEIFKIMSLEIDIARMFMNFSNPAFYGLRGMVCYYGKHYGAYFWSEKRSKWFVFDDTTVKKVGSSFSDVISKCIKGRWQPAILFYESGLEPFGNSSERSKSRFGHFGKKAPVPVDVHEAVTSDMGTSSAGTPTTNPGTPTMASMKSGFIGHGLESPAVAAVRASPTFASGANTAPSSPHGAPPSYSESVGNISYRRSLPTDYTYDFSKYQQRNFLHDVYQPTAQAAFNGSYTSAHRSTLESGRPVITHGYGGNPQPTSLYSSSESQRYLDEYDRQLAADMQNKAAIIDPEAMRQQSDSPPPGPSGKRKSKSRLKIFPSLRKNKNKGDVGRL